MALGLHRSTHSDFMFCMFEKNVCLFLYQNEIQGYSSKNVGYQLFSLMLYEGKRAAAFVIRIMSWLLYAVLGSLQVYPTVMVGVNFRV